MAEICAITPSMIRNNVSELLDSCFLGDLRAVQRCVHLVRERFQKLKDESRFVESDTLYN